MPQVPSCALPLRPHIDVCAASAGKPQVSHSAMRPHGTTHVAAATTARPALTAKPAVSCLGLQYAKNALRTLGRPTQAAALTLAGSYAIGSVVPAVGATFWAAPVAYRALWTSAAYCVSFGLTENIAQTTGSLAGLVCGLLGVSLAGPAAAPAAYLMGAGLGALGGNFLVKHKTEVVHFFATVLGILSAGVVAIVVAALLLKYNAGELPNMCPKSPCPILPTPDACFGAV